MMKAHGISPNAPAPKAQMTPSPAHQRPATKSSAAAAKKRKLDAFADDETAEDDDEDYESPSRPSKIEPDVKEERLAYSGRTTSGTASPHSAMPSMFGMSPHGMLQHTTSQNMPNYGHVPSVDSFGYGDMFLANHNDYAAGGMGIFDMGNARSYNGNVIDVSNYGTYEGYRSPMQKNVASQRVGQQQQQDGEGWVDLNDA